MKSNHVLIPVEFDSELCQPPTLGFPLPLLCLAALVSISFPALKFGTLKFVFHFSCSTAFGSEPADEDLHSSRVGTVPHLTGDSLSDDFGDIYTLSEGVFGSARSFPPLSINACVFLIMGDLIIKIICFSSLIFPRHPTGIPFCKEVPYICERISASKITVLSFPCSFYNVKHFISGY